MIYKIFWLFKTLFYRIIFKKIGINSYVAKPIFLYGSKNVIIGNKVRIFPGCRIEAHNNSKIYIQNNVAIGQNFHITASEKDLIIEANTTISGNVFITNIDHEYKNLDVHIMKQSFLIKETRIGENCFIGYGASIQAGTILGKHCIVGTNSVVRGIFPDYCVIVGVPAKIIKRYNMQSKKWERTDSNGDFVNEK